MKIAHLINVLIITASVYGQRLDCFLSPDQNGHHFAAEIFDCTYVKKKLVSMTIAMIYISKRPIDNKSSLVYVIAWHSSWFYYSSVAKEG